MVDETSTALWNAGPDNWHHLIAPTRTLPLTESTIQAASISIDGATGDLNGIEAIFALSDLAAAANILANAIANSIFVADANAVFKEARMTANILDAANKRAPHFRPTFRTYKYFEQAAETRDPQVLTALLIDIIRIANHITES